MEIFHSFSPIFAILFKQGITMSIIQTIRDRGAKISVILIALALVGFILTDYFSGKGRAGANAGGQGAAVGRVNGTKISLEDFNKKVDQTEENMKQQGYPAGMARQQAIEQAWNSEVNQALLAGEFDKLGIEIGKKELGDILYGPNAPEDLKKQFTDEKTGQFNPAAAKSAIDQMLKKKTTSPEEQLQKNNFISYINQLELSRKETKYTSLFANSVNFPRWFVEKINSDNTQMARISYVKEAYTSIPDSTVKIEDKEIADYISKHKEDFKQTESRNISYVAFNAAPSAADSLYAKNKALELKPAFDTTHNLEQFLAGEGVRNYYDGYISGKTIQIAVKDSIFRTPVGSIYGPYLDGGNYMLAKVIGARQMPDSVKIRHILIATAQRDPQTGQMYPSRDTVSAKKLADSLQLAIAKGSNFDTLCSKFSDDGNKDKGGIYESVYSSQMVAPFNDFIFLNPPGYKGVVKTEFGYHYVEIISQKGGGPAYKIAYLPQQIVASQQTDADALNAANAFAADAHDPKSFDDAYEKTLKGKGYNKGLASGITHIASDVQGVGSSRNFVRNVYAAKKGEVLKPERVDDKYVVAVVTEVLEEGTQSVAAARLAVEPLLRKQKIAVILKQKVGKVTTLEAAAAAWGNKPIEVADSLRISGGGTAGATLGYEPRVSGAAFNPANKGKVVPEVLEGVNGVYVVRVETVSATPSTEGSVADQRKNAYQQVKSSINPQSPSYPVNALKKGATIKDYRAENF